MEVVEKRKVRCCERISCTAIVGDGGECSAYFLVSGGKIGRCPLADECNLNIDNPMSKLEESAKALGIEARLGCVIEM